MAAEDDGHLVLGSVMHGDSLVPAEHLTRSVASDYNVSTMAIKTRIIRIGNSRGIRIPKSILEQSELPEEVEIQAEPGRLILCGARRPRTGWSEAARDMRAEGEDQLLDEPTATEFDRDDWQW